MSEFLPFQKITVLHDEDQLCLHLCDQDSTLKLRKKYQENGGACKVIKVRRDNNEIIQGKFMFKKKAETLQK